MLIVNPIYDKAFKYLMEKNRLAKKVLSVILDEEIVELQLSQQETLVPDEKRQLTLFRLDFKATVRKNDGSLHTVLIELQKSKYITDIHRFRSYLGSNYMKTDTESDAYGMEKRVSYPIITIYILGYKLDDIPYLAVTVNPQIINSVNKEPLLLNSDFINQLNHQTHILQVRRLPESRVSKLEQFLTLFNQAWITDQRYILNLQDVPEEFEEIARYLQTPVMDDTFRVQLAAEEEIDLIFDQQENKYIHKIREAEDKAEQAEAKAEQAEAKAEQERKEKEEAEAKAQEALQSVRNAARIMKANGIDTAVISQATGLSENEIDAL